MHSLEERFRALEEIGPPERWPELHELEPHRPAPPTPMGMRLGVIALALVVAALGFIVAIRTFRTEQPPPQPGSQVENGLIAFARGGPEPGLHVMSPDGSGILRLTSEVVDTDPDWSPDGTEIAFVRGFVGEDAGIYVIEAAGAHMRRITDGGSLVDGADLSPTWAPDGSRIAFAREGREPDAETGNADIYVVDADGTDLIRLTDSPVMEYEPDWSPDGTMIAFTGYDLASGGLPSSSVRLYVMRADGTGIRDVGPEDVHGPAWSPDGSEIAYVDTETGSIMAIRPDGSGRRRVLDAAALVGGAHLVGDVTWSPDGTRLAFMAGPDDTDTHIYVVNRDGSGVVQLTDDPAPDWYPAWQPVLSQGNSSTPAPTVLPEGTISVPADAVPEGTLLLWTDAGAETLSAGSEQSRLVPGISRPLDLSNVGSMVLGSNFSGGSPADELISVDLRTGESSVLVRTEGDGVLGTAELSPDGSMVAYELGAADPEVRSLLCVLIISTSAETCFPEAGRVVTFDWSPDNMTLVVAGPPAEPVRTVDVVSGDVGDLVRQRGPSPINDALVAAGYGASDQLVDPKWSPGGQYLAAQARHTEFGYVLTVFTREGTVVAFGRPHGGGPWPFDWSPVRDSLAYTDDQREDIRHLELTGVDRTLVSDEDAGWFGPADAVWSPSGRWLAVSSYDDLGQGSYETVLRIVNISDPARPDRYTVNMWDAYNFLVDWAP